MKSRQIRGFTLIELVVVITILGILAAFAIPKFVALDTQARISTINGLAGTVKSAAALARSMGMATGLNPVTMEGSAVTLVNNYPAATAAGIALAVNANTAAGGDFTFAVVAGVATWTKVGAPAPATCEVTYLAATAAGVPPVVTAITGGC